MPLTISLQAAIAFLTAYGSGFSNFVPVVCSSCQKVKTTVPSALNGQLWSVRIWEDESLLVNFMLIFVVEKSLS